LTRPTPPTDIPNRESIVIRHPAAPRTGAVVPLVALLMVFLMGMIAFAVDLGYIAVTQKEMQNAADAAAMAGTSQLLDRNELKGAPNQSLAVANARALAQSFSSKNTGGGVSLQMDANTSNDSGGDIVCGRLSNPKDFTQQLDTTANKFNSVQARVRRNSAKNGSLRLFFGAVLGHSTQDLSAKATATYEDGITGFQIPPSSTTPCSLIPFTLEVHLWTNAPSDPWYDSSLPPGVVQGNGSDDWSYNPTTRAYTSGGDGIHEINLYPTKGNSPGNFGTLNLGQDNNGTPILERQILYGPNAQDLASFPNNTIGLGSDGKLVLIGNPGISAGFKDDLAAIRGQPRTFPLYTSVDGQGANTQYTIVAFGGLTILDVDLTGNNKHVTVQPEFVQDGTAVSGGSANTSYFVTKPLKLTR
jgi:Flp pilus assembly protein TadG